uniref:Uncharacterized protein n=1 Tax=Biomphalaria glabrata TaxID=6526 RepID=A0A2C9LW87_BIOGL
MLPVVPNFHDSISGTESITLTSSMKLRPAKKYLDNVSWTSDLTASMQTTDNHNVYPIYVPSSYFRSDPRGFVHSMQISRDQELSSRNLYNSDDKSNFSVSVSVLPKPSGAGYDVLSSSHFKENNQAIEGINYPVNFTTPGNNYISLAPRPQSKFVVQSGSQFSRNIANPDVKKRMQEKRIKATGKMDHLKSSSSTFEWRANSELSFDSMSSLAETYKSSGNSIVFRPTSPLREMESTLSERNLTSSPVDEIDFPLPTTRNTPIQGLKLDSTHDSVFNFHESLFTTPHNDSTDSNLYCETKYRPLTPKLEFSELNQTPGLMSRFKKDIKKTESVQKESSQTGPDNRKKTPERSSESNNNTSQCNCGMYHSHTFRNITCSHDLEARKERRQKIILESLRASGEHRKDGIDDPRNVFWLPTLAFHPYKHGDAPVSFSSLWPTYKDLREILQNSGIQKTVLNSDAVVDLCTLACTCGPVQLLKCLIDLELIRVDQVLESGSGLLHLSVLAHNLKIIQYLMMKKVNSDIRDRQGLSADQVCYNSQVRKHLAAKYLLNKDMSKDKILLKPSLQDKDTIFKLANNPKMFVDIQKKLQTLDFNVNTECDNNGDFLLHLVVKQGLNQLPLLMALVKIQGADIELCNADGMTPLMIAASTGNFVLCDVLICLFGADPNKRNSQSGRSALHYAAEGNHRKTVENLIKRGADVNMEDHVGLRADDIPQCVWTIDDCKEVIIFNRNKRMESLSQSVKNDEIDPRKFLPSDFCVVNSEGHTLIMTAAIYNRYLLLNCLLEINNATIDAQHNKTGMTALAMAASLGNEEAVSILLRYKASPMIADMSGYLPLHHAVLNDKEHTIDIFLDHFPSTYIGLYKAMRICKKTSLHSKLKRAWEKRQEEIITPKLLNCALCGDATELYNILEEGDNINPKSGTGNWPLYLAVENGNLDVLKLLFEKGGDIRKRHFTTGATALHVAAKMGHLPIVSYLLQYCKQHHRKMINNLPQVKGNKSEHVSPNTRPTVSHTVSRKRYLDINAMDKHNRTALQLAAEKGFSKIVDLLLSSGATTAMLDTDGNLLTCPKYEGVRIIIDFYRDKHTKQIMKCIEDKSKKGLTLLQQIWLPKFDHHLRDKEGNTPLMVAAKRGKTAILEFLLESAVYPEISQYESDNETDTDTDSGMLDQTKELITNDDLLSRSLEIKQSTYTQNMNLLNEAKLDLESSDQLDPRRNLTSNFSQKGIKRIVKDSKKPKKLSIYHDGLVSHVCAVNLFDGTTALHQALKTADALNIVVLLVTTDPNVLCIQDEKGETVIHTASRLNRKKCLEFILSQSDVDLNIRTKDGCLPEEVASSKVIRKILEKARITVPSLNREAELLHQSSAAESEHSSSARSSTVNFDKVHTLYEAFKHGEVK